MENLIVILCVALSIVGTGVSIWSCIDTHKRWTEKKRAA